ASEMFRRYYPIQNFNSIKKDIPVDFQTFYLTLWKETAFYPKKNHIHYMGRYSNKKISNVSDWKIALRNHYVKDYKEMGVSKICISYLDSILNLCHQNNIQPILVGSPVHSKYYQGIPQPILKKYYNIVDSYKDRAIIFSRTNDMSYPDSLFYNADHLNQFGSNRFMNEFIGFLNTSGTTNPMSEVYPEKKLK
ncbi:MAG: hypothetical protein MUE99_08495, partial [Chitinophagaceae bacterium]|nr:hypothetical protein [Chitinophagaceae bacterium]